MRLCNQNHMFIHECQFQLACGRGDCTMDKAPRCTACNRYACVLERRWCTVQGCETVYCMECPARLTQPEGQCCGASHEEPREKKQKI
jgi:hypothetical protein